MRLRQSFLKTCFLMALAVVPVFATAEDSTLEIDLGDETQNTANEVQTTNSSKPKNPTIDQKLKKLTGPLQPTGTALEPVANEESQVTTPDDEAWKKEIEVFWYRPEYLRRRNKKMQGIIISGKTLPGATITLRGSVIPYFWSDSNNVQAFKLNKSNTENIPTKANTDGQFYFNLYLPQGRFQIPIVVKHPKDPKNYARVYQLSFKVEKEEVKFEGNEKAKGMLASPFLKKKNHISLGLGYNYLTYSKNEADVPLNLKFETFKGPAFFIEYWRKINSKWDVAFNYKSSPGSTSSSDIAPIRQGNYSWDIITLDGIYFPTAFNWHKPKEYFLRGGFRFGLQYHWVPFLRTVAASSNELEVTRNTVVMGALGYQIEYEPTPDWRYEVFMRYQYPLQVGSAFDMNVNLAFDGSVGCQYNFSGHTWALGAFWYGQWHNYTTTEYDRSLGAKATATQNLFFSNLEGRLIYSF